MILILMNPVDTALNEDAQKALDLRAVEMLGKLR